MEWRQNNKKFFLGGQGGNGSSVTDGDGFFIPSEPLPANFPDKKTYVVIFVAESIARYLATS